VLLDLFDPERMARPHDPTWVIASAEEPTMSEQDRRELDGRLRALYPALGKESLSGLYLCENLRDLVPKVGSYVYTNFITSLDGRIALENPQTRQLEVPQHIANPRDWRLFLELAAPADAIMVSGNYLSGLANDPTQAGPPFSDEAPADLIEFREARGLARQPALVVVTDQIPSEVSKALDRLAERRFIVATVGDISIPAATAQDLRTAGAEVLRLGKKSVEGGLLAAALAERGIGLVYSIAGPAVLHMLLSAGVLQRIYLTTVLRILAGDAYATLASGKLLDPPFDLRLTALYLDPRGPDGVEQLLQVYDRREAVPAETTA
jgi:riboflavin biosynthesis pyrimidine reductase